jgi:spore photoproduct lyase
MVAFINAIWCYLKLTYRANFPYITVKVQYNKIKTQLEKWLEKSPPPVMFNSGELADSLALDHLTGAGREFIPWFGKVVFSCLPKVTMLMVYWI